MPQVRVQYTVRPEFAETNKANIRAVMADLQAAADPAVRYAAYVLDDGQTFLHVAMFATPEAQQSLGGLASFQKFQTELKGSGLISPPDARPLELVGASWSIFPG